jgi:hypothetical protein
MDSLELHKLMREAGVDQDVIDAACRKNNELVKAERARQREEAEEKLHTQRVEVRLALERDKAVEQLLASKPKAVHWSSEDDDEDGRRIDFGEAGLQVQNLTLAQLRQQAEETVVNAVLFELCGDRGWHDHKEWEGRVRVKWSKEIACAAKRIGRAFAKASLRNLMDMIKCDAGMPLTLISKDKVLAHVSEAYDQLVVKSVDES